MAFILTDDTSIYVNTPWDSSFATTWRDFCADNRDVGEDLEALADDLREHGQAHGGGGAAMPFVLTHPDWEPSDDQICNAPGVEGGITYPISGAF